jgi:RNA polymerase sigma-54 factor
MALEAKLYQRLSQQLVMRPQLRQAIKILQVSRAELEQLVDEELTQNPTLEEGIEQREDEKDTPRTEERLETTAKGEDEWDEGSTPRETTNEIEPENGLNAIDWREYLANYSNDWHGASSTSGDYDDEKRPSLESTLDRAQSLTEH